MNIDERRCIDNENMPIERVDLFEGVGSLYCN